MNRKLSCTLIGFIPFCVFGETTITGDYVVPEMGEEISSTLTIETDNAKTYEMTGGFYTLMNVTTPGESRVLTANSDYKFNTKLILSASSSLTDQSWQVLYAAPGKSVTIADLDTSSMNMAGRSGMYFTSTETSDQSQYSNFYVGTTDTSTFSRKPTQPSHNNYEVWLWYVNFYHNSSVDTVYHYVHFYKGCNFICNNDATFDTIAVRDPYGLKNVYSATDAFSGRINMNGNNVSTRSLFFNPSQKNVYSDFFIDYGVNSDAQKFVISALTDSGADYCTIDMCKLIIENFGANDSFLVKTKLDEKYLSILTINGFSADDIIEEQIVGGEYDGYWSYSAIPEPAWFAAIFGAAALVAALRRRSR